MYSEVIDKFRRDLRGVEFETIMVDDYPHVLSIENTDLTTIPEVIGEIKSIEILTLRNNQLTRLPHSMEKLVNLRRLILSHNNLGTLQRLPPSLEELIIDNNQFFDIAWIGKHSNLKILHAQNNNITMIPDTIGELQHLKSLNLANNSIESLPSSITSLKALEYLNIANNEITELPAEMSEMKHLHTIIASNNRLKTIPKQLYKLIELRDLDFSGNLDLNEFNVNYQGKLMVDRFKQEYRKVEHADGVHHCASCGNQVPISLTNCPSCGSELDHCFVCKWGFKVDRGKVQDRYRCPHCHEYFHYDHAMKSLVFSNKCPSCKSRLHISQMELMN